MTAVSDQEHHPRCQRVQEQQVEVADAPEPAELEEERHAPEQGEEKPDLRADPEVGDQRTSHCTYSPAVWETGESRNRFGHVHPAGLPSPKSYAAPRGASNSRIMST